MRYDFPVEITIDEVRVAIAKANERASKSLIETDGVERPSGGPKVFIEADRDNHVIFNYIISYPGAFPFPNTGDVAVDREYAILRECRGLTFSKDGRLLNRKYAKFFNIGEKPETQMDVLDFSLSHVIMDKMDGSMITPLYLGVWDDINADSLRWCTKMGITDVAAPVEAWVAENQHYARWSANVMYAGWTPIYEWCSRKQKIVIDYPKDRLVLTAVRNNKTGEYLPYEEMLKAETHGIEVVRVLPGSVENIETFMAEARDLEGAEGYIIRFDDGTMYKVKGAWYCQIHKTKELMQHEKDVFALIAHDRLDDAKGFMSEEDRERVERFHDAYEAAVAKTAAEWQAIADQLIQASGGDQKAFAQLVTNGGYNSVIPKVLFNIKRGASAASEVRDIIAKAAHPTAGTASRVEAIRHLVGGLSWEDYRDHDVTMDDE